MESGLPRFSFRATVPPKSFDLARRGRGVIWGSLVLLLAAGSLLAVDNAELASVSIPPGTQVPPGTVFTQTWTLQNTGTTTWSPGRSGYTLNLVGTDCLAAVSFTASTSAAAAATWARVTAKSGAGGGPERGDQRPRDRWGVLPAGDALTGNSDQEHQTA